MIESLSIAVHVFVSTLSLDWILSITKIVEMELNKFIWRNGIGMQILDLESEI